MFEFPNIIPKDQPEEIKHKEQTDQIEANFHKFTEKNKCPGIPSWFK